MTVCSHSLAEIANRTKTAAIESWDARIRLFAKYRVGIETIQQELTEMKSIEVNWPVREQKTPWLWTVHRSVHAVLQSAVIFAAFVIAPYGASSRA